MSIVNMLAGLAGGRSLNARGANLCREYIIMKNGSGTGFFML